MPSTRRSSGNTASARSKPTRPANQTKLAFSNRVTKSNAIDTTSAKKAASTTKPSPAPVSTKPEVAQIVPDDDDDEEIESADTSLVSVESGPALKPAPVIVAVDPVELQARGIKETQIKKYYNDQEKSRKAPRIHQGDVSINERLLRSWDVDSRYGPCIGIDRTKRWKRAHKFGLSPPIEILAVLLNEQEASGKKVQRAHLDEIMASKFAE